MSSYAQIRGTWIDVNTYLILDDAGHRLETTDGGLFTIESIASSDHASDLDRPALTHAFVGFDQLVNQGFSIGDRLTINGLITPHYLAAAEAFTQINRRLETLRHRLVTSAEVWGHKQVPRYRQAAWHQQNDDLLQGDLSVSVWLANLRYLLFQERPPSPKFQRFAAKLAPIVNQLLELLVQTTDYGLVISDVTAVSGPGVVLPRPESGSVPIYREVIRADRPMRENYHQQWAALRQAARVYQQTHPL